MSPKSHATAACCLVIASTSTIYAGSALCTFGSCTENCQGDMNGDGVVNIDDTLALIGVFGMCPR